MSEGFPQLEKALTGVFDLKPAVSVAAPGQLATGSGLNYAHLIGGRLHTIEGFSGPKFDAEVVDGEDWITVDNDGKRLRLNAKVLLKTSDGAVAVFKYIGIITLTPEIGLVLSGHESGATVPFGNIISSGEFQTGDPRYKELEHSLFAGSGRFIVKEDKSVAVEYGLSRMVAK